MSAPLPPLVVVVEHAESGVKVAASGQLDFRDCEYFIRETTAHLIPSAQAPILALDIGAVTYCDSAGVAALIQIQRTCVTAGWTFVLRSVHPSVHRVLDMSGLSASFGLANS